jgi:hypothetical protein
MDSVALSNCKNHCTICCSSYSTTNDWGENFSGVRCFFEGGIVHLTRAMVHIDDFPDKVIFEILSHLDKDSFLAAAEVCMKWNRVISENIEFFSSYFQDEDDEQETADATESGATAVV